ncbi:hypothetical protein ACFV4N_22690 [Actinosynnema sp. NPDC059797]
MAAVDRVPVGEVFEGCPRTPRVTAELPAPTDLTARVFSRADPVFWPLRGPAGDHDAAGGELRAILEVMRRVLGVLTAGLADCDDEVRR